MMRSLNLLLSLVFFLTGLSNSGKASEMIAIERDNGFQNCPSTNDYFAIVQHLFSIEEAPEDKRAFKSCRSCFGRTGNRSPLTEAQQRTFSKGACWDRVATWMLGLLFPVAVGPVFSGFTSVASTVVPVNGIGQIAAYTSTGIFPHIASETANKAQNLCNRLALDYASIARGLRYFVISGTAEQRERALRAIGLMTPENTQRLGRIIEKETGIDGSRRLTNPFVVLYNVVYLRRAYFPDYHDIAAPLLRDLQNPDEPYFETFE